MSSVPAPPDVAGAARRKPAWIPAVAALLTVVVCVLAGNWQHRRMHEKEALQAQIAAAANAEPLPLPSGVADWSTWRYRRVTLDGEFDARHSMLVDNRVRAGRIGFDVVTPFALADGRTVLVDRGWIAAGPTRDTLPDVPPPRGRVTFRGRIDIPPAYFELGDHRAPTGPLWQHLDPAKFREATGIGVLPIVVDALEMPHDDGLRRDPPLPDTGTEKHLGYMMQWYTFAAMAAGLWIWFDLRPRWLRRRRR
jgi:surfeit locus 1 family protein